MTSAKRILVVTVVLFVSALAGMFRVGVPVGDGALHGMLFLACVVLFLLALWFAREVAIGTVPSWYGFSNLKREQLHEIVGRAFTPEGDTILLVRKWSFELTNDYTTVRVKVGIPLDWTHIKLGKDGKAIQATKREIERRQVDGITRSGI